TRTKSIGYLNDVRRVTVALSRARLGLYVLGRKELFVECEEFAPAMALFDQRPGQLSLVTGEMYPATRLVVEEAKGEKVAEMAGVEHIGQYVYEMTEAKVAAIGGSMRLLEEAANGDEEVI